MKWSRLIAAVIIIAALAGFSIAQSSNPVEAMALPAGDGTWIIQIFTSGGFTGRGIGDFGVSSEGQVVCNVGPLQCNKSLDIAALQTLIGMIPLQDVITTATGPPGTLDICNDCIKRRLILMRRDAMGMEHIFSISWTETTAGSVPREIMQIYNAVLALKAEAH